MALVRKIYYKGKKFRADMYVVLLFHCSSAWKQSLLLFISFKLSKLLWIVWKCLQVRKFLVKQKTDCLQDLLIVGSFKDIKLNQTPYQDFQCLIAGGRLLF